MAVKALKLAALGLGFAGWALLLAGMAAMQYYVKGTGPEFRNFASFGGVLATTSSPLAHGFSYGWWIVWFQFVTLIYSAFVVTKAPAKRLGAAALLAVLTTSTFLMTDSVYIGYGNGVTSVIINPTTGKHMKPTQKLTKQQKALGVYFVGLLIVDVANALAMVMIADGEDSAAPAAAAVAEAPAKEVEAVASV